jgi:DNA-binding CsgD family transcriptional regulator/tetratricopeptide (TPR) repeat protein
VEATRLSELALQSAQTASVRFATLYAQFSVVAETRPREAHDLFACLKGFDLGMSYNLRMGTAEGLILFETGEIGAAIRALEAADVMTPKVTDPFARTNQLQFLCYAYVLAARYEDALAASARFIEEGRESGLEFAVDHGLLRKASAYIGMRRLREAQRSIDELQRRSQRASYLVLDQLVLLRVKMAIAAGDLKRANVLLESRFAGGERSAFRGEVRGYQAIVLAAQGEVDASLRMLSGSEETFGFVEPDALRKVARAIAMSQRPATMEPSGDIGWLVAAGDADAVVTGLRAYPELARQVAVTTPEQRAQLSDLLARSNDVDIARAAGLVVPRERRQRGILSPRERQVCDLMVQGRANHEIARTLFISESTAKVHVRHILEKLGVHSRTEAARMAASEEVF